MSSTKVSFRAKIKVGEEVIPILSEIVRGDTNPDPSDNPNQAQDGTENGFLFKLDQEPDDSGITIYLGDIIAFIEEKLGVGSGALSSNGGMAILEEVFPGVIVESTFNSANQTLVNLKEFTINSSTNEFLFSINVDIQGTDPDQGFIAFPAEINNWLKIEDLGISFVSVTNSGESAGGTPPTTPPTPTSDTDVDMTVGLNFEVGSIAVSLDMEIDDQSGDKGQVIYTFDGCEQNADIMLGDFISRIGSQFGVDVVLPPELNIEAKIDYVVGQMIYTVPNNTGDPTTTELGVSGRFELILNNGKDFAFNFYADSVIASNATAASDKSYVVGASFDLDFQLGNLPLIGDVSGIKDLAFTNLGFSYTNVDPANTANKVVNFNVPQVNGEDNPLYTRSVEADWPPEPDPETPADPDAPVEAVTETLPSGSKNATSYQIISNGDTKTLAVDRKGFSLTAGFTHLSTGETSENVALPLDLPTTTVDPDSAAPTDFAATDTSPVDPNTSVRWMDINKQIGPVNLEQVGLSYSGGEASFGFSAQFQLSAFMLGLEEMVITFPLPLPGTKAGHEIDFGLAGMTLSIQEPGFEMGASFLRTNNGTYDAYYGETSLKIGPLGVTALGGYTPGHDSPDPNNNEDTIHIPPSLFIYSNIHIPLGGLPCFFITGFSGGFGINNQLVLPTLENLPGYILLPGSAPPRESTAQATINNVLPQMQEYFLDSPGEYWVAAGMSFTSYEMIKGYAMITTSFGVDFEIAIIGSASMKFPVLEPYPVAYFEIDVLASFSAASGLLALEGALAPACFIFGPFCQITGGFAFYLWFTGEHRGEFVVSVGGYNSAFVAPDYYPVVPQLGINYVLGPFHVEGSAYFALTPGMFMAGGEVKASWKLADVTAWFTTYADILIAWAPFQYNLDIYVNVGCSVNMGLFTINMHVGSELYIWGPPFGGTAHVDLGVITFDITFGSDQIPAAPVGWDDFQQSFLPPDSDTTPESPVEGASAKAATTSQTNILKGTVNAGLTNSDFDDFDWIINPDNFLIEISSNVPINQPQWQNSDAPNYVAISNNPDDYNQDQINVNTAPYQGLDDATVPFSETEVWNSAISVRPMDLDDVQSILTFTIKKRSSNDELGTFSEYVNEIAVEPQLSDVPAAQWKQKPTQPDPNEDPFLYSALTGFVFAPIPRTPTVVNPVPLNLLLFQAGNLAYFEFLAAAVNEDYMVTSEEDETAESLTITIDEGDTATLNNSNYVLESINDSWVNTQRNSMLDALTDAGFSTFTSAEVDLSQFASETILTDWPQVMKLGDSLVEVGS